MAIIIHLDLRASEAGITVQLTVVQVRLAIAPAHRPLVRMAFLWESQRTQCFTCLLGTARGRQVNPTISPAQEKSLAQSPCPCVWKRLTHPSLPQKNPHRKVCGFEFKGLTSPQFLSPWAWQESFWKQTPAEKSVLSINIEHNPATAAPCAMATPAQRFLCLWPMHLCLLGSTASLCRLCSTLLQLKAE